MLKELGVLATIIFLLLYLFKAITISGLAYLVIGTWVLLFIADLLIFYFFSNKQEQRDHSSYYVFMLVGIVIVYLVIGSYSMVFFEKTNSNSFFSDIAVILTGFFVSLLALIAVIHGYVQLRYKKSFENLQAAQQKLLEQLVESNIAFERGLLELHAKNMELHDRMVTAEENNKNFHKSLLGKLDLGYDQQERIIAEQKSFHSNAKSYNSELIENLKQGNGLQEQIISAQQVVTRSNRGLLSQISKLQNQNTLFKEKLIKSQQDSKGFQDRIIRTEKSFRDKQVELHKHQIRIADSLLAVLNILTKGKKRKR